MSLQVAISHAWLSVMDQRICDAQYDVTSPLSGVEDTCSIGKSAVGSFKFLFLPTPQVECHNGINRFSDLLPVRADVLDRGSTHAPGNTAKAFDPSAIVLNCHGDKLIPVLARPRIEVSGTVPMAMVDPLDGNLQDQTGP